MNDNEKHLNEVFALLGLLPLKPTLVKQAQPIESPVAKVTSVRPGTPAPKQERNDRMASKPTAGNTEVSPEMKMYIYPLPFNVTVGGENHHVKFWDGEYIDAKVIGCDTETDLIVQHNVPTLALMTVSTGSKTYIIQPKDVISFLEIHKSARLAFHHVAFDFHVLVTHCKKAGRDDLTAHLWDRVVNNEFGDSMILDQLVRLATTGEFPTPRDLATVADTWCRIKEIDKSNPYRLRYGEIIGTEWETVEAGFLHYAAKDAIATALVYQALLTRAMELANGIVNLCWANAIKRFGALTEGTQIRGAVALATVERLGIAVDQDALARKDRELSSSIDQLSQHLRNLPEGRDLFLLDSLGSIELTDCGAPRMRTKRLQAILGDVELRGAGLSLPPIPRTRSGKLSEAEEDWRAYRDHSQFVALWLDLLKNGKARQFTKSKGSEIHPKYDLLKLTGRVSCHDPNLQQMPRSGGFRECHIPRDGFVLFTIDLKYVELVTFAAIAIKMFGNSFLGKVIRDGIDPHCFTAAMLNDMTIEAFMALAASDPAKFKDYRQKAKAINFGILGGQGVDSLIIYARENYNVVLTKEQAEAWRSRLITDVYTEVCLYLQDRSMKVLAGRLKCSTLELWAALNPRGGRPGWFPIALQRVLAGETKKNGERYNARFCDQIWNGLASCCRNDELRPSIMSRVPGEEMAKLLRETVVTPTGRIRANCGYTEARNSPFQGLASDGAKEAIFELVRAGYRVVGFVHDEDIIELPVGADHTAEAKRIEQIVCDSMSNVIDHTVPVQTDYTLSTVWSKEAKCIFEEGRLMPWKPKELKPKN